MDQNTNTNYVRMPLLVTRGLVVFPKMNEEIDVGRPFSILAVNASKNFNSMLFIATQKDKQKNEIKIEDLYDVVALCRVTSYKENPDSYRIRVVGENRARLVNIEFADGTFFATCEIIEETSFDAPILESKIQEIADLVNKSNVIARDLPRSALNALIKGFNHGDGIDQVAALSSLSTEKKIDILREGDVVRRADLLLENFKALDDISKIDQKITNKVRESSEKAQKDYYLRERMKAIKEELGEDSGSASSIEKIRERLEKEPFPQGVKDKVKNEIHRYEMMPESSLESSLIMSYIETLMNIPWYQQSEDNDDLDNVRKVLDEDHYGLENVKKRIIEYLAVKKMTGNLKAPILCFYGPPGCGKTSLGRSIARALDRKFIKASLGGISDESEIRGHRRTYVGSMPGRIINNMIKAKVNNPVFLLDEIDKIGTSSYRGDPSNAMLEVLDPEQNFAFNDNYVEEPYDLSNVLFIATANYLENIPAPLRDRLELIEVPSYTEYEKTRIAIDFLVSKQMKANGLKEGSISFSEDTIHFIINHYTMEAGVRELERLIASICRKAVVEILSCKEEDKKIVIDVDKVKEYLGISKFETSKKEKVNQIGVVTGLAYTEFGGDILPIEVTYFKGKGGLVLTGKLGEVMKESATIALDYVRANAEKYHIDPALFMDNDIHIHVPEGAVPKDGPSAGVALTTAIISSLSHTPVDANVAMTGEVTLRGKALPIGGLREKSLAALRSGIKQIIVPVDNKKNVEELPKEVKDNLKINFMKCVDDALEIALVHPAA